MSSFEEIGPLLEAVAIADFVGSGAEGTLSFEKGDLLRVVTRDSADSFIATNGSRRGRVPASHVRVVAPLPPFAAAQPVSPGPPDSVPPPPAASSPNAAPAPELAGTLTDEDGWADRIVAANAAGSMFGDDDDIARRLLASGHQF